VSVHFGFTMQDAATPAIVPTIAWRPGPRSAGNHSLAPAFVQREAASSVGAFAVGALALGALALGALAIGALAVKRARIQRLEIDELFIGGERFRPGAA